MNVGRRIGREVHAYVPGASHSSESRGMNLDIGEEGARVVRNIMAYADCFTSIIAFVLHLCSRSMKIATEK